MATKLGTMVTHLEGLLPIKLLSNTYDDQTWQDDEIH